eukprot:453195_1
MADTNFTTKSSRKRSLNESNDHQCKPPNKKQKTMKNSPNTMEMMINFMQNKPEEFMIKLYANSITLYQKYKDEQLIKQFKITNQNEKPFLSIFNAIEQSELSKTFSIPQVIISEIAQYTIGKVFICAHNVCDEEIFVS